MDQKAIVDFHRRAVHLGRDSRTIVFWKPDRHDAATRSASLTSTQVKNDFDVRYLHSSSKRFWTTFPTS